MARRVASDQKVCSSNPAWRTEIVIQFMLRNNIVRAGLGVSKFSALRSFLLLQIHYPESLVIHKGFGNKYSKRNMFLIPFDS